MHPRLGTVFMKPAAPLPLRAFLCALRTVNAELITSLANATGVPHSLTQLLSRGATFADVAVQIHCGAAVDGDDLGWHRDAINSCVHLALSLRGRLALVAKLAEAPLSMGERASTDQRFEMASGDVYVSMVSLMLSPTRRQNGMSGLWLCSAAY